MRAGDACRGCVQTPTQTTTQCVLDAVDQVGAAFVLLIPILSRGIWLQRAIHAVYAPCVRVADINKRPMYTARRLARFGEHTFHRESHAIQRPATFVANSKD